jgi:hypothetical protein
MVKIAPLVNQKYFIGDDSIAFSGINTASNTTYLFITGPNLDPDGSQIQSSHPGQSPVIDSDASTFLTASVGPDNQWSYTWNTRKVLIDAGMYTVFAASTPRDFSHINDTHYAKVAFIMKRPANIDSPEGNLSVPSVVRQGNKITISGTAKGNPYPGVAIWVIGAPVPDTAGYANQFIVQPDSTGFYSLDLDSASARLEEGRYHVVVQHPMQNNVLDIYLDGNTPGNTKDGWVWNRMLTSNNDANGTKIFKALGPGSLQGDDAFEALIFAFEDPVVDDIIAIAPLSTATPTGSGNSVPGLQNRDSETQNPLTGEQDNKTAGSGSLLDQVWGFLAGIFRAK